MAGNRGRLLLSVAGVALGVALGVAVHLINGSAITGFSLAARALRATRTWSSAVRSKASTRTSTRSSRNCQGSTSRARRWSSTSGSRDGGRCT
ncbi:MAG: hypothetical protein IPI73_16030 [Betaproteobacteria bacterium]|nr:hypothetical protein [Betaproteobacteria bacterium]